MAEAKETILIVDDTRSDRCLLERIVGKGGYPVQVAESGAEALERIREQDLGLVLLDVLMPDMDGFQLCSILQSSPATRGIPILLISATMEAEAKTKGFSLGAVDYVTKPYQAEEVLARIRTHLRLSRLEKRLRRSEAFMRRAERIAGLGTWLKDLRTGAVEWSDEVFRLLREEGGGTGRSFEEILERVVVPGDRNEVRSILLSPESRTPGGRVLEFRLTNLDRILRATTAPWPEGPDEQAELFIGTLQDVSALRAPVTTEVEDSTKWRRIVDRHPDGFLTMDADGRLLEANDALVRMSGMTRERLFEDWGGLPGDVFETIRQAILSGRSQVPVRFDFSAGASRPFDASVGLADEVGRELFAFLRPLDGPSGI